MQHIRFPMPEGGVMSVSAPRNIDADALFTLADIVTAWAKLAKLREDQAGDQAVAESEVTASLLLA